MENKDFQADPQPDPQTGVEGRESDPGRVLPPGGEGDSDCPAGGVLGRDLAKLNDCQSCELWDLCVQKADDLDAQTPKQSPPELEKLLRGPRCPGGGFLGLDLAKLNHCQSCLQWEACIETADELGL